MSNKLNLNDYKQQIAELYSRRSHNYDESEWHFQIAHRLVDYAQISCGNQVLDIATGTGMAAVKAAQIVGSEGQIVGIDISTGMLEVARQKVEKMGLKNVEFKLADAESLNFPAYSFDRILCSSAFIWMSDLLAALRLWYQLLKPEGILAFHAFAETSFVGSVVVQELAEKYGISLAFSKPTGTIEKCYNLLDAAGYQMIEIQPKQYSNYLTLEEAKQMWVENSPAPGQFPHPLSQISVKQLSELKDEFEAKLESLTTEQGIWNDITVFFCRGRKLLTKYSKPK